MSDQASVAFTQLFARMYLSSYRGLLEFVMPSTRDLGSLPDVDSLKRLLQSLATLDAILCPDWEFRYYSFNAHWAENQMMGSMRNGCGDSFLVAFNGAGCFLKGFAHESPMSPYKKEPPKCWPGLLKDVPEEFDEFRGEPAFSMNEITFCIWRSYGESNWMCGKIKFPKHPDPDGSEQLLSILDGKPETYANWAESYFEPEQPLKLTSVGKIYAHAPLTKALAKSLNPDCDFEQLSEDLEEIGYPSKL